MPMSLPSGREVLRSVEVDVLIVALAPELDLSTSGSCLPAGQRHLVRPTVDLALNLLCSSAEEWLVRRAVFNADAALLRGQMIELLTDGTPTHPCYRWRGEVRGAAHALAW
jgi:Winged helix domain, variant